MKTIYRKHRFNKVMVKYRECRTGKMKIPAKTDWIRDGEIHQSSGLRTCAADTAELPVWLRE